MSAVPSPPPARGHGGLPAAMTAEWIKLRTVRGWVVGLLLALALCVGFTYLVANGGEEGICTSQGVCTTGHPFVPAGPNGEPVADSYRLAWLPLSGNGAFTARIDSLTGLIWTGPSSEAPTLAHTAPALAAWAKAGIMITSSARQGSPYAAIMATGGHGVRFQYDYVHDEPGMPGGVTAADPRWLRLARRGDTVTAYDSTSGTGWRKIGSATLAGLPDTVKVGLFVTSPVSFRRQSGGSPTQATASFDHVSLDGRAVGADLRSRSVGMSNGGFYPTLGAGGEHRDGGALAIDGSGDVAAAVNPMAGGDGYSEPLWFGLIVALIAIAVIATAFVTGEYRRGLIRTTLSATPARGRVLAAKALVIGAAAFLTGLVAASVAVPLGVHLLEGKGDYVFPAGALTQLRLLAGTGALLALAAVAALALGAILRSGAAAVSATIVAFVLPYAIGSAGAGSLGTWLLRLTPAAGFAILGSVPRSALVESAYTMSNGYYPLPPLAGLGVLCAYVALALWLALRLLRRRDA